MYEDQIGDEFSPGPEVVSGPNVFVYDGEFPPVIVPKDGERHLWCSDGETFVLVNSVWTKVAKNESPYG